MLHEVAEGAFTWETTSTLIRHGAERAVWLGERLEDVTKMNSAKLTHWGLLRNTA